MTHRERAEKFFDGWAVASDKSSYAYGKAVAGLEAEFKAVEKEATDKILDKVKKLRELDDIIDP